jgi:DNA invertase Pin-like site-specific DNA recombinase
VGEGNGVTLGKVVKEEDVSGARPVVHRGLEELIQRAQRGESRGVLVHRIDRFGRDHTETIVAAKRLRDAGARLVGVADGVDSEQQAGKIVLNVMSVPRRGRDARRPRAREGGSQSAVHRQIDGHQSHGPGLADRKAVKLLLSARAPSG